MYNEFIFSNFTSKANRHLNFANFVLSVDYSAIWRDRPFRSRFRKPSVANVGDFILMIGLGDDGDSDM